MLVQKNGMELLIAGFALGLAVMFIIGQVYISIYFTPCVIQNNTVAIPDKTKPPNELGEQVEMRQASSRIVAVSQDGTGIVGNVTVEIRPGKGRILFSTNPFAEPDTQESLATAVRVAANYTGYSTSNMDVIATFDVGDPSVSLIGGPSAGISITLATIAALEGKQVRPDVAMTGTIESDGTIGPIGAVLEKAQAAANAGMTIFLVPKGQGLVTYYERQVQTEQRGNFIIQRVTYVPHTATLDNYTMQWGMHTYEVSSVSEAAMLAIWNPMINTTSNAST